MKIVSEEKIDIDFLNSISKYDILNIKTLYSEINNCLITEVKADGIKIINLSKFIESKSTVGLSIYISARIIKNIEKVNKNILFYTLDHSNPHLKKAIEYYMYNGKKSRQD